MEQMISGKFFFILRFINSAASNIYSFSYPGMISDMRVKWCKRRY